LLCRFPTCFRDAQCFFRHFAGMPLVSKLFLACVGSAFRGSDLLDGFRQPFLGGFVFCAKLNHRLAFAPQHIDRFALSQFRMTDLGLQVTHDTLRFGQRPLSFFARRGFGGQSGFSALQAAAGGGSWRRRATVRGRFVRLVPAQNRYRNVAVLDEAAAVLSPVEPVAHASGLIHPIAVRAMS
jgi:hypothetical protein